MYPKDSKDSSPLSDDSSDQFDKMMAGIMQGSIAMAFRQLIEPATNKNNIDSKANTPPPLKLHDFGGSDFVRLAEKSRRNRSSTATMKPQGSGRHGLDEPMTSRLNGNSSLTSPTSNKSISLVKENQSTMKQPKQDMSPNNDWKCTQECVFRTDGSEETVYQKFHDGQVTETLHHVLYPDGTIKNIKKPMITPSPSTHSSLSSLADDTPIAGPFKRLWHLVFD